MPGTLTVTGMSAGLVAGETIIGPVTTTGTNTVGEILPYSLAIGDNTIAIPTGATSVAVFLGSSPAATVKFRTNLDSADGGVYIAPVGGTPWFKKDIVTGETSVILNSSATLAGINVIFI